MGAHAHMTGFMETRDYNFSHRIEKLTFGDNHAGIIQPLEGDEKITDISEKYLDFRFVTKYLNF